MKKRVLSLFMAFVLCLTLLPTSAFAVGGEYVAKVGDTEYETLQEILEEMEPVEITLLGNVTEDLTVYAATTIIMNGYRITGGIDATDSLTLTNGTVKGNVKMDGGTFTMTAPANAEAAIDGGLEVKDGSCNISGAKIGVKNTLYFDGKDMTISGTDKAVALDKAAEPTSKTLYGSATVDGKTTEEAEFDADAGTYKVNGEVAKKLSNQPVGGSTTPAATLTITPETASTYNGQTVTFTGTYTGTDALKAYVQGNAVTTDDYFTVTQKNNNNGTYSITIKVDEKAPGGDYTLHVHEVNNSFVQAKATITVTVRCNHGGTKGFDINADTCPDCGAPAVAYTELNLPESEGNPWRKFADLQDALDADRNGGSVVRLLADVSGDYTIDGSTYTGLDLNGYSIKGTVSVTGNGGKETAFSNSKDTGSIKTVVAHRGANLAGSGYPAVIGTLEIADTTMWQNLLKQPDRHGFKVRNKDGTHKWYAASECKEAALYNVTIESLPITSKNLSFKVNGENVTGNKVDRGTTVQFLAYCNTSDAEVTFYVKKPGSDVPTTYSSEYKEIGTMWYYVAEYTFDAMGSYEIYFSAAKDGYTVTSVTKKLTVNKATIPNDAITAPTAKTLTYTGQPQALVNPGELDAKYGTIQYSLFRSASSFSTDIPTKTDAGTYTVYYKVVGNENYKDSAVKSVKVTISPVKIDHVMFSKDISKTYDGTAAFDLVPADKASYLTFEDTHMQPISVPADAYEISDVRFVAENADHEYVDSPDAGNKAIHFTVTFNSKNYVLQASDAADPASSMTYNQSGGANFTIKQAVIDLSKNEFTQIIYNDLAKTYEIELQPLLDAILSQQTPAGVAYGQIEYPKSVNEVHFTVGSYFDSATGATMQAGILRLPILAVNSSKGEIGTVTVTIKSTNYQPFDLTIKIVAQDKLILNSTGVTVSATEITYGQWLADSMLTVTGTMKDPRTGKEVMGTFMWKNSMVKPNAGSYDAEWVFTPTAPEYAAATGKVTVKVNKAASSVTAAPTANELTYNGSAQELVTAGTASGGAMKYRLGTSGEFTAEIPTAINAGTYTVYYMVAGDGNHNDTDAKSVTVTIAPKKLTIEGVTVAPKTYDGTATATITGVTFDGLVNGESLTPNKDYTASGTFADANAGKNKTVNANITLKTSVTNYTLTEGTYRQSGCTINKAPAPQQTTEWQLYVTNDLAKSYEIDLAALMPTLTSPREYGGIGYPSPTVDLVDGYCEEYTIGRNTLTLKIKKNPVTTPNPVSIGKVIVTVITTNYEDITLTIPVFARDKIVPELDGTVSASAITYGQTLADSTITPDGVMRDNRTTGEVVPGTFTWKDSTIKPNAGSYEAEWVFTPNAPEYATATGKVTVTVNKAASSVTTAPAAKELTYNGSAQELVTAGTASGGTMKYRLGDNGDFSTDIPTAINAGTYTVYFMVEGDSNHKDTDAQSVTVTIKAKTVSEPTITVNGGPFVYTGSEIEPEVTVKDGETEIPASQYTVSYKDNTNVGTATVTVTGNNGGNYSFTGSETFTITKAGADFTAPAAKELTYNGKEQELVTAGTTKDGTMKYRLGDSGAFTTDIPTAINAGTYTVYYMVAGDSNHNDTAAKSVTVTIKAKTVSDPTIIVNGGPFVYTGSEIKPEVTVKDGDTVIPAEQYTVSYKDNTNVGTATVTVTSKNGGNYVFAGSETFTITKAGADFTAPTAKELTYSGSAQELVTAGTAIGGTMKYRLGDSGDFSTDIPTANNAGTYTVYYMVAGDSNHNDTTPQSVTVTIKAKTVSNPTITVNDGPFVYTGSEIKPTVTVKDGETEIPASQYTVSYKDNTNVGTATVTVTSKTGGNYSFTGSKTFIITKADSSAAAPTANTLTYNGKEQTLVTAGTAIGGTMKYRLGDSGDFSTAIPTATNAGAYTVYYMVEGDGNHNNTAPQSVTATIKAKEVSNPAIIVEDGPFVYTGSEIKPAVTVKDGETEIPASQYTVSYKDNTNVGTATVTVTSKTGGNYSFTGSKTFTITKAGADFTAPAAKELTYNGSAQELVAAGTATGGKMKYSLGDSGDFSTAIPTATNAGTYTVYYMVAGDSNHKDTTPQSVEVTIAKATLPGVSVRQDGTLTYNGKAQTATVITAATPYGENKVTFTFSATQDGDYTDAVPAFTNADTYTVYYKAAADNHETASGSFTVTIDKAKLENVSVTQRNELTYNGSEQTVEVDATATTVDGSDVTFTYSMEKDGTYGDLPTFTNAGIYTVWYKAEAENHETVTDSFTVTVEKATVTVTTLDKTAYVGDKAPDLSKPVKDTDYTVSDMFGDDQLAGTIKLAYVDDDGNEIVPNMSKPGEVIIRASGLTDPNENYTVVFVDGKLTISYRPSSGGSGHGDYVIKASAGTGGSISPSGNVSVRKGGDQTFTITPDKGYAVADVKVDGKSVGAVRSYTFKDIKESHTIEVSFVKAIGAPDTGDGSNMLLWFALLFASACGLAGTTFYKRRKRAK